MVVGVGIVGELLHSAVTVDGQGARARGSVADGVLGDFVLCAVGGGENQRICRADKLRLQVGAGFAQVDGMGAHVANFQHPLPAEFTLDGEVPLLGGGGDEMPRHRQNENAL